MIRARARAKINWALHVLSRRADGYHEMDMLMESVGLWDELAFYPAEDLTLFVDGAPDPFAEKNLVLRAARALQRASGKEAGARIELNKRIPARAGLGGGSADCAAALICLNRMWNLRLPEATLMDIGLSLGADVPFCLRGGLARARGLGERLEALSPEKEARLMILMPDGGLSTGEVFSRYDAGARSPSSGDMEKVVRARASGDWRELDRAARNALTEPALEMSACIARALEELKARGCAMARMSGSGSAVFGVFEEEETMVKAREAMKEKYPFCQAVSTVDRCVTWEEEA